MIDYRWVTEETKTEFEVVLRKYGVSFIKWRATHPSRKAQPLETAYLVWWGLSGPTGFRNSEDALRFKGELLTFVNKMIDEPVENGS